MDFTKKDARTAAETAQFCNLRWPETGEYIIDDGKAVGVMVIGAQSRSLQEKLREDAKAKLQDDGKDQETQALEDIQRDFCNSAARLTVGFVNVQRGEVDAVAPDDCEWFYDLNFMSTASLIAPKPGEWQNQSFAQQVLKFAGDASNFLGET